MQNRNERLKWNRKSGMTTSFYKGGKIGPPRAQLGGQIAELGPALFLLLIVIFFPLLDLIRLGLAYGAGWYLNQLEARAVAVSTPPLQGPYPQSFNGLMIPEVQAKETAFMQVIGQALGLQDTNCAVTQNADPANPAVVASATVTNTIKVTPYLLDRWYLNVKGLDTFFFQYTTTELQEERGLN